MRGPSWTNQNLSTDGGVVVSGSTICVATTLGVEISTNGGASWTAGAYGQSVKSVAPDSSGNIYATTTSGLLISIDGGFSFANYTTYNGLGSNNVWDVAVSGSTIYAATLGGLSISTTGAPAGRTTLWPTGLAVTLSLA